MYYLLVHSTNLLEKLIYFLSNASINISHRICNILVTDPDKIQKAIKLPNNKIIGSSILSLFCFLYYP